MDKYEEALERAKAGKPIDEIFPELKESEDERMRTRLIALVEAFGQGEYKNEMLAYLERQKEQKPVECIEDSVKFKEGFKAGRESGLCDGQKYVLDNLDSYGLCKPAEWSEEDEKTIDEICCNLDYLLHNTICAEQTKVNLENRIKWLIRLKSLRPQPRWKPSEEQISALEYFIRAWGESGSMSPQNPVLCAAKSLLTDLQKLL